jgi:hypothetical protein
MKSFDSMKPGDDTDFETQLRQLELRRPPAEWKSLLLPKPVVPWFPKPLVIALTTCWATTAGFLLTTPENEILSPPLNLPAGPRPGDEILLGFNPPEDFIR